MEYWGVINEAIARLRGRKNRPDVDNILGVLNKKKPTISKNVLENALNQLEKHNKLYRVYYKGHTSYRQTAFKNSGCDGDDKQVNQNGSFSSDTEEDTDDKSEAFGRPIADEDMSQDTVVTPTALDDVLQDRSQSVLSSDSDSVHERPGMGRKRPRPTYAKDSDRMKMSMKSKTTGSLPLAAARVSSRKRIKKTHGPDWQTDVLHLECKVQLSTCAVCRSKDVSGNLLSCSACKVHVHARCLQLTERSVAKISANKQFYCLRCKPCKLCHYALEVSERDRGQNSLSLASIMEGGDMIHCCQCYSVFHLGCLRPTLPVKPKGQPWMCRKCSYEANKKEKLKANAAATAMLMVAQQRPLLPDKSERAPVTTDKESTDQQGGSGTESDRGYVTPTSSNQSPTNVGTATAGNNNNSSSSSIDKDNCDENSVLRNGHTPLGKKAAAAAVCVTSASLESSKGGALVVRSNGSSVSSSPVHENDTATEAATAVRAPITVTRTKQPLATEQKATRQNLPDVKVGDTEGASTNSVNSSSSSSSNNNNSNSKNNNNCDNGDSGRKNNAVTSNGVLAPGAAIISIMTPSPPVSNKGSSLITSTVTGTGHNSGGNNKTNSDSLINIDNGVTVNIVNNRGNKTGFKASHSTNEANVVKAVATVKEEIISNGQIGTGSAAEGKTESTETRKPPPSELRRKLLEITAPVVTSSNNGGGMKVDDLKLHDKEQASKLKAEEQGRQLVFIAGKSPANTKLTAIPGLPRCELTFHIPKQLSVATPSLDGTTLASLTCSSPTTIAATSTTSIQHVLSGSAPIMTPSITGPNLTPIVITSIPKKVHTDEHTLSSGGTSSRLTGVGCPVDNPPLTASLSQIQIVPVSLATAPTMLPSVSLPLPPPLVTSTQTCDLAIANSGGAAANTAKLEQFAVRYPNVSDWSADQVAEFLAEMGYEKESKVFVEQEIDGASLLLLKRADVLSTLGLKLGPAVKIFRHISNLQEVVAP